MVECWVEYYNGYMEVTAEITDTAGYGESERNVKHRLDWNESSGEIKGDWQGYLSGGR